MLSDLDSHPEGCHSTATREALGTSLFDDLEMLRDQTPPSPGRARDVSSRSSEARRPALLATGSPMAPMTTGIVLVACFAAPQRRAGSQRVTMTSTLSPTSSASSSGRRSALASGRPVLDDQVASFDVAEVAQSLPKGLDDLAARGAAPGTRRPIRGILRACCASAASGAARRPRATVPDEGASVHYSIT